MGVDRAVVFREVQRFRQWWVWLLVLWPAAFVTGLVVYRFVFEGAWGRQPGADLAILLGWAAALALPLVFCLVKLTTEVRPDGLYLRFWPFHLSFQRVALDGLASCRPVVYRPAVEYGGWGIRHLPWSRHKCYNVSGNRGVKLEYKDGRTLLIGSQMPDELAGAIELLWQEPAAGADASAT